MFEDSSDVPIVTSFKTQLLCIKCLKFSNQYDSTIDLDQLGKELLISVGAEGLKVWCTPGSDRNVLIVTFLRRNSSVPLTRSFRDASPLAEATADLS